MKKMVKSSIVVLALGLGLSIGTAEEAEAMYDSPYAYFDDYGIRGALLSSIDRAYYDTSKQEKEKLYQDYDNGLLTDEQLDTLLNQLDDRDEKSLLERIQLFDQYGLMKLTDTKKVTHFDTDFEEYSSLTGFEKMTELEQVQGEGGNFNSFRELSELKKLKTVLLEANNQLTLNSFKNLSELESLVLWFDGYENRDEQSNREYTQALTTDISALSNLDKLKELRIGARGRMATITLKKGTTSYQLYDPVVPSKQFDGLKMNYFSDIKSNEWLEWNDLTGDEKYLEFSWSIEKNRNLSYSGDGQIPIRWK